MRIATTAVLIAALAAATANSAPARAQAPGLVHGCVNAKTRALTIPAGSGSCPPGTTSIRWQVAGPAGADGTPGWGLTVPGTQFESFDHVIFDGQHLWATNDAKNSMIEVDPATRAITRSLTSSQFGFSSPTTMATGAGELWVVNSGDNSVTE